MKACENGTSVQEESETYFAELNIYTHMAHYVAKVLKQRPSAILDSWGVAELLVAYGQYANEESYKNFLEWKSLDNSMKNKIKKPKEYAVFFYSVDDLQEEES